MNRSLRNFMRVGAVSRLTILLVVLLPFSAALSCPNPGVHKEWDDFNKLVEELGPQPKVPLQVMYRISSFRAVGRPATVTLSVQPRGEFDSASFSAAPSEGLSSNDALENVAITEKQTLKLSVTPEKPGVHYLTVGLHAVVNGEPLTKTLLVPMAVGLQEPGLPSIADAAAAKPSFGTSRISPWGGIRDASAPASGLPTP